jgi:hypothetical protein
MDLTTRTRMRSTTLRYFLSDLGDNKVILGYPWFAATQPKIDWEKGWIAYNQLPIVLQAPDTSKACFLPWQSLAQWGILTHRKQEPHRSDNVPLQYRDYRDVFEQCQEGKLPPSRPWDHTIELKPEAPPTLISKTIHLSQTEQQELLKFIKEHTTRGTICLSKSPYATSFIKKKNGKLRPVQVSHPIIRPQNFHMNPFFSYLITDWWLLIWSLIDGYWSDHWLMKAE